LKEINKNKTININDLLLKIKSNYPSFDLSSRQLSRVVKDNNITLKLRELDTTQLNALEKILIVIKI
jgi:hypothetical protein